jgi:hypothetical protein
MTSVIEQWQAQTLVSSVKPSRLLDTVKEPPNALILCVNLQNLPLADTVEWVRHASEDEIKAHKGLRCGFFVAHILYPGFTYVSAETHKGGAGGAGGDKAALRGERLAIWDDEALRKAILLFGYKGAQQSEKPNDKQGARYVKTKRYDECASVGKGMVISASIWANKLQNSIKKPSPPPYHNLAPFQLCLVQLGIKSVMSNSEKGMMLDIKHVTPVEAPYSLSMCDLVSNDLPPHSLQESAEFRTRFLEGALVTSEQHRKHLNQDLIKGNFSTTMHLLALSPEPRHGAIAVAADGKLKLFQQQPMGDVSATTIELSYNAEIHGVSPNEDASVEWLAKLFNIAMMLGALELLVIVDEYRMRNGNNKGEESLRAGATSDVHLQAFARVNERLLLAKLVASVSAGALLDAAADQGIFQYITDEVRSPCRSGSTPFTLLTLCPIAGRGPQAPGALPSVRQGRRPPRGHAPHVQQAPAARHEAWGSAVVPRARRRPLGQGAHAARLLREKVCAVPCHLHLGRSDLHGQLRLQARARAGAAPQVCGRRLR